MLLPNPSSDWCGQRLLWRPSGAETPEERAVLDATRARPVRGDHGPSVQRDSDGVPYAAPVSGLVFSRRPATVFGSVVSVIVDALKGVLISWRVAHVGVEGLERPLPTCTDSDSAASVVSKAGTGGHPASVLHPAPHTVDPALAHAVERAGRRQKGGPCDSSTLASFQGRIRDTEFQRPFVQGHRLPTV